MTTLLRLIFTDWKSVVIGGVAAVAAAALFTLSGQMITVGPEGPVLLVTPEKALIFAVLAILVGLEATLQSYAWRLRVRRDAAGAGVGGVVLAFLGASCCTPLLWPTLLSMAGVSGVTLLGFNAWLHQWFWIPVTLSAVVLILGFWRTMRAIAAPCPIPPIRS